MVKSEERPISHIVGHFSVVLVVVPLVERLGLLKAIAHVLKERSSLLHALGDGRHTSVARLIGPDGGRVTTVDDPEWSVLERALVGGVEDELRPREPAEPLSRSVSWRHLRYMMMTLFAASDCPTD